MRHKLILVVSCRLLVVGTDASEYDIAHMNIAGPSRTMALRGRRTVDEFVSLSSTRQGYNPYDTSA